MKSGTTIRVMGPGGSSPLAPTKLTSSSVGWKRGLTTIAAAPVRHAGFTLQFLGERYDGTPFTARGFERIPPLEHLQGWLLELMPA